MHNSKPYSESLEEKQPLHSLSIAERGQQHRRGNTLPVLIVCKCSLVCEYEKAQHILTAVTHCLLLFRSVLKTQGGFLHLVQPSKCLLSKHPPPRVPVFTDGNGRAWQLQLGQGSLGWKGFSEPYLLELILPIARLGKVCAHCM